jgi:pimeloyl-ACP methyl ester carboxylesterase
LNEGFVMPIQHVSEPGRSRAPDEARVGPVLLIDQFLPRYDLAIVHAKVLRAPPEACYRLTRSVDLLRAPIIRALLDLRTVPQRVKNRLSGRHVGAAAGPAMPSFRLTDMVRPPINWRLLDEEPGVGMVLGQIGRPWQPTDMGSGPDVAPCEFAAFQDPGFAKIALSLRVQPYGAEASILTLETRVAVTDPVSLRRFQRYWALIGPFSHLVRWIALRLVAADLRRAQPGPSPTRCPTTRVPPAAPDPPLPTVTTDGLAVFARGEGPPLLLMPYGHAVSVVGDATMERLLDGLAGLGRRVVTFDPPGSGRSTRQPRLRMPEMLGCAEETLATLRIDGPVDVFGHSQGGVAALAFALERPERVRRLVLANTSSGGPAFLQAPGALWNRSHPDFWRFALLAMLYLVRPTPATETLMNNLIFRDSYVERARFTPRPIAIRDWFRPARPRAAWGTRVSRRLNYSRRLGLVRAPTLVLVSRFDPQMPPACGEELARGIRDARLVRFERSGHYPFVEEPEPFWSSVSAFLAGTGGPAGGEHKSPLCAAGPRTVAT